MLHKCVATNRCCPKLHEENLGAEPDQHSAHLYSNPYLHEDPRLINAIVGEDNGLDFPASAMALMYDPTSAQPEEQQSEEQQSEDEEEGLSVGNESAGFVEDVDDFMSVPKLVSSSPPTRMPSLGGALRIATGTTGPISARGPGRGGRCSCSGPSIPVARPPSLTANWDKDVGDEGSGAGHARSSSAPRSAAPSTLRPSPAAKNAQVGGSAGSKAQPPSELAYAHHGTNCTRNDVEGDMPLKGQTLKSVASQGRLGHLDPTPGIKVDRSFPGPGDAAGGGRHSSAQACAQGSSQTSASRPALASSMAPPLSEQGGQVHRQHKTLSRSLREARACKSEAGAASIAAILQVVAQAQEASDTPLEPGRDPWHGKRWADGAAERQLVSGH